MQIDANVVEKLTVEEDGAARPAGGGWRVRIGREPLKHGETGRVTRVIFQSSFKMRSEMR